MIELLADISLTQLLVRMITTALIIIIVATAVGKLGPIGGGLIAGLPIGFGPGFYFLLNNASTDFLIQTATFSLLALSATQIFLTTYIATAKQGIPLVSLSAAVFVWVIAIAILKQFPVTIIFAATLFIGVTFLSYLLGRQFKMPKIQTQKKGRNWERLSNGLV